MEPITRTPRHLVLAGLTSAVATVTAAWWWLDPDRNHFADPDNALLRQWLDPGTTAGVMLAIGLLGTVLAAAGLRLPDTHARLAVPAAGLAIGGFGLLGMGAIAATGYLVAMLMPFALGLVVVQLVRRGGVGRWVGLGAPTVARWAPGCCVTAG